MHIENLPFAIGLSLLAGLSTGIGSLLAFFTKATNTRFLSVALGFSAGVMIYISMIEIYQEARTTLIKSLGEVNGSWAVIAGFFLGITLIAIIDRLVPSAENPHESRRVEELGNRDLCRVRKGSLLRTGLLTAGVIALHNFPEGLATLTSALQSRTLGTAIAVAVAIHNIPEGIAVSIPVFCATNNKRKALMLSLLSGLAEPLGAITGYFLLQKILNETISGMLYASIAGIMVFISIDELLPTAREYGEAHLSIYGLVCGMLVMAISLQLFIR